jgi:hypothetical protein
MVTWPLGSESGVPFGDRKVLSEVAVPPTVKGTWTVLPVWGRWRI